MSKSVMNLLGAGKCPSCKGPAEITVPETIDAVNVICQVCGEIQYTMADMAAGRIPPTIRKFFDERDI